MIAHSVLAVNSKKCSKMLNAGWFKKYKYMGVGEANQSNLTKGSKKDGSTKATSSSSTENSTAITDPGYTTNVSVSNTRLTSSFGECSLFALKQRQNLYITKHYFEIINDIKEATEHLDMITYFSRCTSNVKSLLKEQLRQDKTTIEEKFIGNLRKITTNHNTLAQCQGPV